jgi:hypothetical protein
LGKDGHPEAGMIKVKGIYDGSKVVLLEPVSLQPNTPVEVLIPEEEQIYWQRLNESGLIKEIRPQSSADISYAPVKSTGVSVSETIIKERR